MNFPLSPCLAQLAPRGHAPALSFWRKLAAGLAAWWQHLRLDDRTAYLSRARDFEDLEQRMRAWDRPGRNVRWPLY